MAQTNTTTTLGQVNEKKTQVAELQDRLADLNKHALELNNEICDLEANGEALLTMWLEEHGNVIELQHDVDSMPQPQIVGPVLHLTGGKTWLSFVVSLCLELPLHGTMPSCIARVILTVALHLFPDHGNIKGLPGT